MHKEVLASGHLGFNKAGLLRLLQVYVPDCHYISQSSVSQRKVSKSYFYKSYFQKVAFRDELPENLEAVFFSFIINTGSCHSVCGHRLADFCWLCRNSRHILGKNLLQDKSQIYYLVEVGLACVTWIELDSLGV